MRLIKCFVVFGLSLLMGACPSVGKGDPDMNKGVPDIDIGDYENQLAAWNSLNMLNYQLVIADKSSPWNIENFIINVKNGIPESSDPRSWLGTTIPEIFFYIKRREKEMRDRPKNQYKAAYFNVYYHPELYYPAHISTTIIYDNSPEVVGAYASSRYSITLTPLGENEQGNGEE
jgi:hypothetical protein